jgi:ATP-binding cassette subfamily C (CFTR/MRP) protein 1
MWILAVALLVSPILASILMARHTTMVTRMGMNMKTALTTSVFQKSMVLSATGKATTSTGQIVNLMSNDGDQIYRFMVFFAQIFVAPLQIIVCMVLIYFQGSC